MTEEDPVIVAAAEAPKTDLRHTWTMDQTTITAAGAIDTFLVLLIGVGPKIALVPFLEITASLDPTAKRQVLRKMRRGSSGRF